MSVTIIRNLFSPSVRFEIKQALAWLRDQLARARLWRWEFVRLQHREENSIEIFYAGLKEHRELAKGLLGLKQYVAESHEGIKVSLQAVYVCDMPIPGALRVPHYLSPCVPLGRPIEEITARYDSELRRRLRKQRAQYRMRQLLDDAEIDRADREMLRPYATARQGDGAVQLDAEVVWGAARKFGRLDAVYLGDEPVACHLGHVLTRRGKRYWTTIRFGYPEAVFSNPKRLREVNSITTYLALEYALENRLDYYNIGGCLARPDDGLLQWKRRRGGAVDTIFDSGYFYVRLPRVGAAQFLWNSPLFSVARRGLSLRLGLPDGPSDEDVLTRYREMGYGGLSTVYLHCDRAPGERLLDGLRNLYAHEKSPPAVVSIAG